MAAQAAPECMVVSASLMPLVTAIEAQLPPEQIARECGLEALMESFLAMGCEALVVGCTHFPYVLDQIKRVFTRPIIDPGRRMLELLGGC